MAKQSLDNIKQSSLQAVLAINQVEGFNPAVFAKEFIDEVTGAKHLRLPVSIQLAWFRLKYPNGKVLMKVQHNGKVFVGEARVYMDAKDPVDCCLASSAATRGPLQDKPGISPREWAQTAALGIALRSAGFGLQFDAAEEEFSSNAVNELMIDTMNTGYASADELKKVAPPTASPAKNKAMGKASEEKSDETTVSATSQPEPKTASETEQPAPAAEEAPAVEQEAPAESHEAEPKQDNPTEESAENAISEEDLYEQALGVPCPVGKYNNRTMGEVLQMDPGAIAYVAKSRGRYEDRHVQAAQIICNHAVKVSA